MMSNIDGMMADYDQISAEREELLESLADVNLLSIILLRCIHNIYKP